MNKLIESQLENGLLTIRINRPEKKNALTNAMYSDMADLVRNAASNDSVGCILFTGGKDFSAGNDLVDFLEDPPMQFSAPVFKFMQAVMEYPLPIIAAVDGFAVGIGTTLLAHCDFVYATPAAVFKMPFVDIGLVPEFGITQLLPERIGHQKAAEFLLLCDKFDAQTAHQIGLVNRVCETTELLDTAKTTAEKLLKKPRTALRKTKALMRRDEEPLLERVKREAMLLAESLSSDEARNAFKAILKK